MENQALQTITTNELQDIIDKLYEKYKNELKNFDYHTNSEYKLGKITGVFEVLNYLSDKL